MKYDDILERYWKFVSKFQGIRGQNYDSNKFSNNKAIIMLSLKYPQFNLGFSWIILLIQFIIFKLIVLFNKW